jgi:hypothetical protein
MDIGDLFPMSAPFISGAGGNLSLGLSCDAYREKAPCFSLKNEGIQSIAGHFILMFRYSSV